MRSALVLLLLAALPAVAENQLQQLISDAIARGESHLRLPPGEMRVDSRVYVHGADGLTISGPGTTIVFTDPLDAGFMLDDCSRLTLRGFTVDCDPLPFTQGTIVSISEDRSEWEFEVHEGYPALSEPYLAPQAYVYDPATGRIRRGAPDIYPSSVEALSERRGRMRLDGRTPGVELVEVGDLIVLNIRDGAGIFMHLCSDLRLEGVTMLACPGMAFIGRYLSGDNVFRRLTVRPGPLPEGATQPRLMSAAGDALNIAYSARGPLIERCRFRAMGDDSINLHGPTFPVCAVEGSEIVLGRPYEGEPYERMVAAGDVLHGHRQGDFAIVGEGEIVRFERADGTEQWRERVQEAWPKVEVTRGSFFRVRLREALPIEAGDWVTIPATGTHGFVIRDCEFRDHRARGMRIQASHGVIEGNRLSGLQGAGITIGPEFGYWREANWVEDLIVRDNVIEEIGRGSITQEAWGFALAGITVFGRGEPEVDCAPGNRGIVLSGNTIEDCPTAAISVTCSREVQVKGNRIAHTNYRDGGAPIAVSGSEQVLVDGNHFSAVGEAP